MIGRLVRKFSSGNAGMGLREKNPHDRDYRETQHTAFRTDGAATEPVRAAKRGAQQVSGRNHAAVWNRVEESLTPIPSRMKAYGEPKRAGALKRQAKEKTDKGGGQRPGPLLTLVAKMD